MADWQTQYLNALKARDELEQADTEIYNRCTQLADQNAALKAELRKLETISASAKTDPPTNSPVPAPLISYGFRRHSPKPPPENDNVAQLRQNFATAQRERADLQRQVEALERDVVAYTSTVKTQTDHIGRLTSHSSRLTMKLKDREEELRGKAKLLVNVQDEIATLNLELNQAEVEINRVKKENQELVDRWVARMGREADRMNEESQFS